MYTGWAGYDGARDSSRSHGRPLAQQGLYDSATTVSVHGGIADVFVHTEGSTPYVAAITPRIMGQDYWDGSTYGRYSVRFRADVATGYKMAWLLWPASEDWTEGEIDFPEGNLGKTIAGASHYVTGDPRLAWNVRTEFDSDVWHTATIEWTPDRVTFDLDGTAWTTTDPEVIPTDPMRWVLQTETLLSDTAPDPAVPGHVEIDWLAAWRRA